MHLNFEDSGESDKPAVLLVHGFLSSNSQWITNKEALSSRYRLIMAELWGHGDSPVPDQAEFRSSDTMKNSNTSAQSSTSKNGVLSDNPTLRVWRFDTASIILAGRLE